MQIAKTEVPCEPKVVNGILYKYADVADHGKFKLLSDNELLLEVERSQEMAKTILGLNGKIKNRRGSNQRPLSASYTFVPPKFGTANTERKIQQRQWEKEKTLSAPQEPDLSINARRKSLPDSIEFKQAILTDATQDSTTRKPNGALLKALAEMQQKYESNLGTIAKLFSEKQEMEKKLKQLEKDLNYKRKFNKKMNQNRDTLTPDATLQTKSRGQFVEDTDEVLTGTADFRLEDGLHMGDQSAPPDEEATSVSVGTSLAPPSYVSHEPIYPSTADNSVGLTATQASLLFDKRGGTLDSAPTRRRPSSAGGNLTSRSRSGSIAGGVSAHTSLVSRSSIVLTMQADIDRYEKRLGSVYRTYTIMGKGDGSLYRYYTVMRSCT